MSTKQSIPMEHLHFRVPTAEKGRFQRACKRAQRQQSEILRKLMLAYVAGDIAFTETMEIK